MNLSDLESKVAVDGLTHEHMLDFFRIMPTSASDAILPTFETWTDNLRDAGVEIDEDWYNRMIADWMAHGRLSYETLILAPPLNIIQIGQDTDAD